MAAFDSPVIRAKVRPDMVGSDCLLMLNTKDYDRVQYGEMQNAHIASIPEKRKRSYEQLGLYWACCSEVAQNTEDPDWDTQDKVDEQCKIKARHVDCWLYYENTKTGERCLNIKTKSISFKHLAHIEACGYFTHAFETMALHLGITVDELIENTKRHMRSRL